MYSPSRLNRAGYHIVFILCAKLHKFAENGCIRFTD